MSKSGQARNCWHRIPFSLFTTLFPLLNKSNFGNTANRPLTARFNTIKRHTMDAEETTEASNYDDSGHRAVQQFLSHCHLQHYLPLFLAEGFDSLTSVSSRLSRYTGFFRCTKGSNDLLAL
ncbi:hypothetical protein BCR43DRAFT_486083 [Syncephalastrum racemosum]|uniref:Uncharacterized protein n=1 Tax=Syncephalastrum racemosum TaxID=13706 RepID=A0A1X2HNG1_SYNRA|nr:hypothetical protein BCR43DRAFT_486083 [Syncephalastrum racemosum]